MKLTPREKDKLLISLAALVAKNRLSKGIRLNYPEAIALITDFVAVSYTHLTLPTICSV